MKHVVGPTYVTHTVLNLLFSVMHSPSALVPHLHINRFAASASAVGKQLFHHIAAEHLPLASNCALVSTFNVRLRLVPTKTHTRIVLSQQYYPKPEPEESWAPTDGIKPIVNTLET